MGIQTINVGTSPNDGTGDSLRTSFTICNNNFSYLNSVVSGNGIISANSMTIAGNVFLGQTLSFSAPNANLQYAGTANSYVQMVMQNKSPLTNASTDYIATADNGNDSSYFVDMGIASSTYYYPGYTSILPNDSYLISNGGNLLINAGSPSKSVKFVVGGSNTSDIVGQISNTAVTFSQTTNSISTTSGALVVGGGAGISGNIYSSGCLVCTNGVLTSGTYSGPYTDGIVMDYITGNGRISVGSSDGIILYNGGLASSPLLTISNVGNLSFQGTLTTSGNITTTGAGVFSNVVASANAYIGTTSGTGFNLVNMRSISHVFANQFGSNATSIGVNIALGHQTKITFDINANVTLSYNSIQSGSDKVLYIRNKAATTANVILPNNNNNKASNVIPISSNVTATFMLFAVDTTAANVVATIINS